MGDNRKWVKRRPIWGQKALRVAGMMRKDAAFQERKGSREADKSTASRMASEADTCLRTSHLTLDSTPCDKVVRVVSLPSCVSKLGVGIVNNIRTAIRIVDK
ncbi:hypothetical protein [Paenibacillus contaminans]|uniref:Uncharacterized protein n=1 Tax=Paenibacillus contaminans TaxID=450362 RepID=A0A329MN53_9BACL|nr:hypothetical protein [Paenibacillus contaminans]RAV19337.1 hypothetical protein DQG23_20275 [Paenibacillus contaminans]